MTGPVVLRRAVLRAARMSGRASRYSVPASWALARTWVSFLTPLTSPPERRSTARQLKPILHRRVAISGYSPRLQRAWWKSTIRGASLRRFVW